MSTIAVCAGVLAQGAAGASVIAALCICAPVRAQEASAGQTLFAANGCYQCHGYQGQGGTAGPRIAPSPYPYAAFAQLVRRPASEMPAYATAALGNEDLREIYAYVRAMPEPPALEDIPALR